MEEENEATVKSVSIKFGLIIGLISIIYFVILDFLGLASNQTAGWLGSIFTVAVMYFAHKEYINNGDGYMSYGQGLGIGTLMSLVGGILSGVFTFIYISFVNTEFITSIREKAIMDMEEQGLSDAQIEQAMKFTEMFTSPTALLIFGIVSSVFLGFIISLIVSAITKKSRPEFE